MLTKLAQALTVDALPEVERIFGRKFFVDPVSGGVDLLGSIIFESREQGDARRHEFALKIWIPNDYPQRWLKVWEVDNKIPLTVHKNPDQSLCLGSHSHIRKVLAKKYDIPTVVQEIIAPHLAACIASNSPSGELAHGPRGLLDDLVRILKIEGAERMGNGDGDRAALSLAVLGLYPNAKRMAPCPCGSGALVARCHGPILSKLSIFEKQGLYEDVQIILRDRTIDWLSRESSLLLAGWIRWAIPQFDHYHP